MIRVFLAFILSLVAALPASAAQLDQKEKLLCGAPGTNKILQSQGVRRAIKDFCSQPYLYLDTNYDPDRHFYQAPNFGTPYKFYAADVDGHSFKLEVRWGDFGYQSECIEKKSFGIGGQECERKLTEVVENCQSSDEGYLSENAENGCVLWEVQGLRLG